MGEISSYALSVANLCEGILLLTTEKAIENLINHWDFTQDDTPITTELHFLIQKTKKKLNKMDVELYDLFIETVTMNSENIFERCANVAVDDISESLIEESRVIIETTKGEVIIETTKGEVIIETSKESQMAIETSKDAISKIHIALGKIFLYSLGYTMDELNILDGTFTPLGAFLTTVSAKIPKIKLDKEMYSAILALQKIDDYENACRYLHALHSIARTFNIIFPGIFSGFYVSPAALGPKFQLLGNEGLVVLGYLNNIGIKGRSEPSKMIKKTKKS
jgi:hypothetical protein